jgi:hypothetical protein
MQSFIALKQVLQIVTIGPHRSSKYDAEVYNMFRVSKCLYLYLQFLLFHRIKQQNAIYMCIYIYVYIYIYRERERAC